MLIGFFGTSVWYYGSSDCANAKKDKFHLFAFSCLDISHTLSKIHMLAQQVGLHISLHVGADHTGLPPSKCGDPASWPELPHVSSALTMPGEMCLVLFSPYEIYPPQIFIFLSFPGYDQMIYSPCTDLLLLNEFHLCCQIGKVFSICNRFSLILFTTVSFQNHSFQHIFS